MYGKKLSYSTPDLSMRQPKQTLRWQHHFDVLIDLPQSSLLRGSGQVTRPQLLGCLWFCCFICWSVGFPIGLGIDGVLANLLVDLT